MNTAPASSPAAGSEATADDLCHVYCCDPTTAWCGTDVSDAPEVDESTDLDCVVCADLEDQPCPTCGA